MWVEAVGGAWAVFIAFVLNLSCPSMSERGCPGFFADQAQRRLDGREGRLHMTEPFKLW